MKVNRKAVVVLASVLMVQVFLASVVYADTVLIGNKDVQESSLSKSDVKQIFLAKKKTLAGGAVKIAIQKDRNVNSDFLSTYINKSESQFSRYYKKLVFTGRGKSPKKVKNDAAMNVYVAKTSGAIGYVSEGAVGSNVKQININ